MKGQCGDVASSVHRSRTCTRSSGGWREAMGRSGERARAREMAPPPLQRDHARNTWRRRAGRGEGGGPQTARSWSWSLRTARGRRGRRRRGTCRREGGRGGGGWRADAVARRPRTRRFRAWACCLPPLPACGSLGRGCRRPLPPPQWSWGGAGPCRPRPARGAGTRPRAPPRTGRGEREAGRPRARGAGPAGRARPGAWTATPPCPPPGSGPRPLSLPPRPA